MARTGLGRLAIVATAVLAVAAGSAATSVGTSSAGTAPRSVDVGELRLAPMPVGGGTPQLTATTSDPASPRALADDYTEVELALSASLHRWVVVERGRVSAESAS